MEVGKAWVYMARTGLQSLPDNVRVTRRLSVDGVEGVELMGDLGVSHVAWSGSRLITDQMAGCRFLPPLPLLAVGEDQASWRGWVYSGAKREPWKAQISSQSAKLDVLGTMANTVCSSVDMSSGPLRLQVKTWFEPGVGIVRQEQRTNDRLDLTLELLTR
jgi:hypothetical protein